MGGSTGEGKPVIRIDTSDILGTADRLRLQVAADGHPEILSIALQFARLAAETHRQNPSGRAFALSILCVLHRTHAARGGGVTALREAVGAGREACDLAASAPRLRERCKSALATALLDLHCQEPSLAVLDEAVALSRQVVDTTDPDDVEYAGMLGNLANALLVASDARDDLALLDESIVVTRSALWELASGDDRIVMLSTSLASALWQRIVMTKSVSVAALREAQAHAHAAVRHMPPSNPQRASVLQLAATIDQAVAMLQD